jgi:hypothetical protein
VFSNQEVGLGEQEHWRTRGPMIYCTPKGYRLARSSTLFTQAERVSLALVAARSYRLFRSSLTLIVRYSRSPFSTGGRPLGFFSMAALCTNK